MEENGRSRVLLTGEGRVRVGWRLLLFFVVFAVIAVLAQVALAAMGGVGAPAPEEGGVPGPSALVAGNAIVLFAALAAGSVTLALDDRGTAALGFHPGPGVLGELAGGLGIGTAAALLGVGAIGAAGGFGLVPDGGSVGGWFLRGGEALLLFAVPAAAEEALFRGYPLQALAESFGRGVAVAVTGGIFGLVHLNNPEGTAVGALSTGLAGVFLAVLYLKSGSLWLATGAHLGWNWALGFLADVPVSGLDFVDTPLYDGEIAGTPWLSGGGFGPEGSVLTAGVVALLAAGLWLAPWPGASVGALNADPLIPLVRDEV